MEKLKEDKEVYIVEDAGPHEGKAKKIVGDHALLDGTLISNN